MVKRDHPQEVALPNDRRFWQDTNVLIETPYLQMLQVIERAKLEQHKVAEQE